MFAISRMVPGTAEMLASHGQSHHWQQAHHLCLIRALPPPSNKAAYFSPARVQMWASQAQCQECLSREGFLPVSLAAWVEELGLCCGWQSTTNILNVSYHLLQHHTLSQHISDFPVHSGLQVDRIFQLQRAVSESLASASLPPSIPPSLV